MPQVTSAMKQAGRRVIENYGDISDGEELAERIYLTMRKERLAEAIRSVWEETLNSLTGLGDTQR